jgi:glutathione S-transferase
VTAALASLFVCALAAPLHAQERMSKESVATLKAAFTADLQTMQDKYLALAQAFPQEKYTWRPMDGVRSVAEVLMLAAFEGYSFIPTSWGGKPADLGPREEANKLRTLSDKAQVIEHLKKGFAHAKAQLDALDPATFTGTRKVFNQERSAADVAMFVGGDLHEHLGQLIAYARMNQIVPPWSK